MGWALPCLLLAGSAGGLRRREALWGGSVCRSVCEPGRWGDGRVSCGRWRRVACVGPSEVRGGGGAWKTCAFLAFPTSPPQPE